jgi:hypothetical protein
MALIGSLILGMNFDVANLSKGFKKAKALVDDFAGRVQKAVGKIGDVGKALGSGLGNVAGKLKGMATSAGALGVAIGGALGAGALGMMVKGSLDAAVATGLLAKRIGTTAEAVSRLQYAASASGIEAEEFGDAWSDMGEKLGDAAGGGGDAIEGLAKLGLDLDAIRAMKPEDQFMAVADAIKGVGNQADRLNIADQMFGGSGQKMMPFLLKTREELQGLMKDADRLGATFSGMDVAKAMAASQAMGRAKTAVGGLITDISIILAPIIERLANRVADFVAGWIDGGKGVQNAIKAIGKGIAAFVNGLHTTKLIGAGVFMVLAEGGATFLKSLRLVGKVLEVIINLMSPIKVSVSGTLDALSKKADEVSNSARKAFDKLAAEPPPGNAWGDWFVKQFEDLSKAGSAAVGKVAKDADAESNQKAGQVQELINSLTAQRDAFGMGEAELAIAGLGKGVTNEQISNIRRLYAELENLKKAADLREEGKQLTESLRTPGEVLRDEVTKLREMLKAGVISDDTFRRGVLKAGQDAQSGDKLGDVGLAGALDARSAEARSALLRASGLGREDGIKDVARINKDQLGKQNEGNRILADIHRALTGTSAENVIEFTP